MLLYSVVFIKLKEVVGSRHSMEEYKKVLLIASVLGFGKRYK